MNELPKKIEHIIAQRQPLAGKLTIAERHLGELSEALYSLEKPYCNTNVGAAHFAEIQQEVKNVTALLQKLHARFSRSTLNIGVVGRARQGKSRLLQSLTGLSRQEIPDSNRGHCTGVRSMVCHKPDIEPYAEITFYNERDFLQEVIAPYYDALNLGTPPLTIRVVRK